MKKLIARLAIPLVLASVVAMPYVTGPAPHSQAGGVCYSCVQSVPPAQTNL